MSSVHSASSRRCVCPAVVRFGGVGVLVLCLGYLTFLEARYHEW